MAPGSHPFPFIILIIPPLNQSIKTHDPHPPNPPSPSSPAQTARFAGRTGLSEAGRTLPSCKVCFLQCAQMAAGAARALVMALRAAARKPEGRSSWSWAMAAVATVFGIAVVCSWRFRGRRGRSGGRAGFGMVWAAAAAFAGKGQSCYPV